MPAGLGSESKEADRPVHPVAALQDDVADFAVVDALGQFLQRPAVAGHQAHADLEVLGRRRFAELEHALCWSGRPRSPASP